MDEVERTEDGDDDEKNEDGGDDEEGKVENEEQKEKPVGPEDSVTQTKTVISKAGSNSSSQWRSQKVFIGVARVRPLLR